MDATTQVRDVVSEYFNAPAKSAVKVYTQAYLGNNTWGDKVRFDDARISVSGNTVTVTNFNYKENFVSDTPRKNPVTGETNFYGKKLIIEFDVTAKRTSLAVMKFRRTGQVLVFTKATAKLWNLLKFPM